MKELAVLTSREGTGTHIQAIFEAINQQQLDANLALVICVDAEWVNPNPNPHIPTLIAKKSAQQVDLLQSYNIDYIVLAAYRKIIPNSMLEAFPKRIINVHPGLVPDTADGQIFCPDGSIGLWNQGKLANRAIQNFLDQKATYAGSTAHFLTPIVDFGPVLKRTFEKIQPDDTVESLYSRLKIRENQISIESLMELCNGE